LTVTVTAYCPCHICCGKSDGITCSGVLAKPNHTIAVYLEGLGTFVAEDTGGVIKGNRIDIFMNDHHQALLFGLKEMKAHLVQEII
jgi:3D (Asp-Asp-Asp) domain-containing protein